ncbi:glycosyltransferase [Luteimonas sp. RIT-PG2_3]
MRIALVTPILPVPHDQARGRYIHETARALSTMATVKVFFPQVRYPRLPGLAPRSFLQGEVGADYSLDGIDMEAYTYPGFPGLSRGTNGIVGSWTLTPRLRAFAPDLVLAYWIYPDGYAAVRAAARVGVPCIVGARGSDIHVRSGINKVMTRRTLAAADTVLTVSHAMRAATIADYGVPAGKVHAIVNGIDTGIFHPRDQAQMRQKLGVPAQAKVIVYVGRLVETKGMRELLVAFQRLAAEDASLHLALVGDGVMRQELATLVQDSGLSGRVLMPGGMEPSEVAEWICASDVLTLPSWSEGYPNVVVEGIACGCPVVATDVGGTREIINADNGIMVAPKDVDALTQALSDAMSRAWDHQAMASAMRRGWHEVAVDTLAVCRSVLEDAGDTRRAGQV